MDETTNQVAAEDTELSTLATDDGVTEDQLLDDEGNPIEPEEEQEEIELDDDLKLTLPKSQAEKLRLAALRQQDYTRKTQELADARKAFEAERETLTKADDEELSARANLNIIDHQLAQYAQVNWPQAFDNDPFEASKAFAQYQLLDRGKQQAQSFIEQRARERSEQQQQETAKLLQEGAAQLARDIPGWSQELSAKLQGFGAKELGMSKDDFDGITDPRAVKLLHAAYQWHQHEASQKKAKSIQKQQEVQPAAAPGRKTAPAAGLSDDLSPEEWTRRRNQQIAKRAMS